MANRENKMVFIGITTNLVQKVSDYKNKLINGFDDDYKMDSLVYYEEYNSFQVASDKEAMYKKTLNRDWLFTIIDNKNPTWKDLADDIRVLTPSF